MMLHAQGFILFMLALFGVLRCEECETAVRGPGVRLGVWSNRIQEGRPARAGETEDLNDKGWYIQVFCQIDSDIVSHTSYQSTPPSP